MNEYQQKLEGMERKLRSLHADGHLELLAFHKGLLCLAYEWAVQQDQEEAKRLVGGVTQEYLENALPQQMVDDPEFHHCATVLARFLDPLVPEVEADGPEVAVILSRTNQGLKN